MYNAYLGTFLLSWQIFYFIWKQTKNDYIILIDKKINSAFTFTHLTREKRPQIIFSSV